MVELEEGHVGLRSESCSIKAVWILVRVTAGNIFYNLTISTTLRGPHQIVSYHHLGWSSLGHYFIVVTSVK